MKSWRWVPFALGVCFLAVHGFPSASAAARPAPPPTPRSKTEWGIASWYRAKRVLVAAHRTFPFGTKVKVLAKNGRSVTVTIASRGPFRKGRIIDLSSDAFKKLASLGTGLLTVTVQRLR